jgi:hypothetical protein
MLARRHEAVLIGEGRAVTPGKTVGGRGGGDRGVVVPVVDLNLGEHGARVGIPTIPSSLAIEGISAFLMSGGLPMCERWAPRG